jgi:cytochrome b pre-mRNA-processing protein 3|tara:strand:+ start:145 stop:654 length:510 start_codon:yes stop_codon:yes gene_type:complete
MHILNKNIFKYNDLYNKIISLTREKFFYTEISLKDELITRIYLVLFHLGFILELLKKNNKNKKLAQNIYDSFFINIDLHLREIGHGDVSVNKKMKDLIKLFYEILLYCEQWDIMGSKDKMKFLKNLFDNNNEMNFDKQKLLIYLDNYRYNLKDISLNFLIKGIITNKNY